MCEHGYYCSMRIKSKRQEKEIELEQPIYCLHIIWLDERQSKCRLLCCVSVTHQASYFRHKGVQQVQPWECERVTTKLIENDAENVNEEVFFLTKITASPPMYGEDWSDNFFVFILLSQLFETKQKILCHTEVSLDISSGNKRGTYR